MNDFSSTSGRILRRCCPCIYKCLYSRHNEYVFLKFIFGIVFGTGLGAGTLNFYFLPVIVKTNWIPNWNFVLNIEEGDKTPRKHDACDRSPWYISSMYANVFLIWIFWKWNKFNKEGKGRERGKETTMKWNGRDRGLNKKCGGDGVQTGETLKERVKGDIWRWKEIWERNNERMGVGDQNKRR